MNDRMRRFGVALIPIGLAAVVALVLLAASGANPFEAFELLWTGSLGTSGKIPATLITWVPLTLAAAGLIVTFSAGLWNIGIEGQIVAGAVAAAFVALVACVVVVPVTPMSFAFGVVAAATLSLPACPACPLPWPQPALPWPW